MRRWWLALALLLVPSLARATPIVNACNNCTSVSLAGVGAGWTYFVQYLNIGTVTVSDTFALTFTSIRADSFTDSFGLLTITSLYAHTGVNTGNDTFTFSGNVSDAIVEAWPPTDVKSTGSPVDSTCFCSQATCGTNGIPTGTNNVHTCSVTSHQSNDIYQYWVWGSIAASCFFEIATGATNGPTVNRYLVGNSGCGWKLVNLIQPVSNNTIVPSGAPQTFVATFNMTNTGGGTGFLAAQHVLLLPGASNPGSAKRKHPPYIVKFLPPKRWWRSIIRTEVPHA